MLVQWVYWCGCSQQDWTFCVSSTGESEGLWVVGGQLVSVVSKVWSRLSSEVGVHTGRIAQMVMFMLWRSKMKWDECCPWMVELGSLFHLCQTPFHSFFHGGEELCWHYPEVLQICNQEYLESLWAKKKILNCRCYIGQDFLRHRYVPWLHFVLTQLCVLHPVLPISVQARDKINNTWPPRDFK